MDWYTRSRFKMQEDFSPQNSNCRYGRTKDYDGSKISSSLERKVERILQTGKERDQIIEQKTDLFRTRTSEIVDCTFEMRSRRDKLEDQRRILTDCLRFQKDKEIRAIYVYAYSQVLDQLQDIYHQFKEITIKSKENKRVKL